MSFKVEKGVQIPPPKEKKYKYPFLEMEVGDSFAYPAEIHHRVMSYCQTARKNTKLKFSFRKLDEECRCWRVE